MNPALTFTEEVADALAENRPIIAMESTHELPYPQSVNVATSMQKSVRELGVVPATVAILKGRIHVGLTFDELEWLATQPKELTMRCSQRNLPQVIAQKASGETTVAGTMFIANLVGILIMTTGGIGGVHRNAPFDVSADVIELGRTPITVVCSGVKPFLDIYATREVLETHSVLIAGLHTNDLSPFFNKHSGVHGDMVLESLQEIAQLIKAHLKLKRQSGLLVPFPVPEQYRYDYDTVEAAFTSVLIEMEQKGLRGPIVTTWMIKNLIAVMGADALKINNELLIRNAITAAKIAAAVASLAD